MYIYTLTLKAKTQWQCKQTVIICVIAGGRGSDVLLSLTARVETAAQCPELCESQWGKLTVTLWIHLYFSVFSGFTGLFLLCCADTNTWKNITYISIQQEVEQSGCRTSCDLKRLPVGPDSRSTARFTGFLKSASSRFERARERRHYLFIFTVCVLVQRLSFSLCVSWISIASRRPRDPEGEEGSVQSWQRRPLKRRMERRLLAADKPSV